jgi:branched-chain amino acid transport system permease protein
MTGDVTRRVVPLLLATITLALIPLVTQDYFLHIAIQILLWGFVYTAWSMMGRFGLVSLGHGAFLGVGAYVAPLLWNYAGLTPWLGIPLGVALAVLLAVIIGYPCFRLRVVGHYFALVTLALSQVALLTIVAARDFTGGSLGMTPKAVGHSWYALQFPEKPYFYAIALVVWVLGIAVWHGVDIGKGRAALEAISEDEGAAAAIGVDVMREKLRVTVTSAALTAFGGALLSQYFMYVNPDTLSGIGVSLQIVFAAIAGGMYSAFGPTAGGLFTIALPEILRISIGTNFVGAANTIYGALLVIFIIFMPRGVVGLIESRLKAAPLAAAKGTEPKPSAE